MSADTDYEDMIEEMQLDTLEVHPFEERLVPAVASIVPAAALMLYGLRIIKVHLQILVPYRAVFALFFFAFGLVICSKAYDDEGSVHVPFWAPCILAAPVAAFVAVFYEEFATSLSAFVSDWQLVAYSLLGAALLSVVPFYLCIFARMLCARVLPARPPASGSRCPRPLGKVFNHT